MQYDGHVRIDSRMDTAGFNKGISKVGAAMKGFGKVLAMAAIAGVVALAGVLLVVVAIVRGMVSLAKTTLDASKNMVGYAAKVDELKLMFANLKLAVSDAFRPLILFALPWIEKLVAWVTTLLNLIAQVLAGLTGQAGYWKSTAKAAGSAAGSSKEMAENTKKAGEAAEGALASFDQLNVLDMAKENEPSTGGGAGAGVGQEWVPLGEKALVLVEKIKEIWGKIKEFLEPVMEPLRRIWDSLKRIWEQVKIAAGAVLKDLGPAWIWFRDEVLVPVLDFLADILEKIADWAEKNPEKIKGIVFAFLLLGAALLLIMSPAAQVVAIILLIIAVVGLLIKYWPEISRVAAKVINSVISFFVNLWNSIKTGVSDMAVSVRTFFTNLWFAIKLVWFVAKTWFQNTVIDPLVKAWDTATGAIKGFFSKTFDTIKSTVKNVINEIIGFVNNLIRGIVNGINEVIRLANGIAGTKIPLLTTPTIPKLASGAVIPPNAQFLAVLGDQRSGTNIEAPESLIRQIVREETAGMGSKEVTINFAGSLGALVRELKPYIDKENNRIGRSLVKGVTA
jgi:hypothetical protein